MRRAAPSRNRIARLLGDLKLHRPLRLLLHDNRARGDMTALDHNINKGKLLGQKPPLKLKEIWIVRIRLLSMARLNYASSRAR
jgi:hypothetical protein